MTGISLKACTGNSSQKSKIAVPTLSQNWCSNSFGVDSSVMLRLFLPLLDEVSEERRELWNKVTSFRNVLRKFAPKFAPPPQIPTAFLAGRRFLPSNFTRFIPRIFQMSNRNSPKNFKTHFCRHGNPNKVPAFDPYKEPWSSTWKLLETLWHIRCVFTNMPGPQPPASWGGTALLRGGERNA